MNLRPILLANGTLLAAMAGISAWAWNQVPAKVPIHWNIEGQVDRLGSKEELLLLMPAIAALVTLLLVLLPRLDPRRANIEASAKFWTAATVLPVTLLAYTHALLIWNATGHSIDVPGAIVPALSVLFIGIGNYLGKTRSNWFGGIRTPWSLSSDYSWEHTHRWGGRLFVASGVLGLVAWLLTSPMVAIVTLVAAIAASALAAVVMSYVFWRADPDRSANGSH